MAVSYTQLDHSEILDADYENINSLRNLDITDTVRCGKHNKNCALQNVFEIYNW